MRKSFIFKTTILAAVIALVFFNASCKKQEPKDPNTTIKCVYTGTVENIICGSGEYGSAWIKLDDGTYLQPCQTDFPNIVLKEGQRVKVGYKNGNDATGPCSMCLCAAVVPNSKVVHITCLQVLDQHSPKESTPSTPKNE